MIPVPRFAVAWLLAADGSFSRRRPGHPPVAAVACSPDRLVLWLADGVGGRRAVDCLRARPWLTALLLVLAPLFRLEARDGRLRWRPHPAGVLFALDALVSLTARRQLLRYLGGHTSRYADVIFLAAYTYLSRSAMGYMQNSEPFGGWRATYSDDEGDASAWGPGVVVRRPVRRLPVRVRDRQRAHL
jgi:hypothetical protein